MKKIKVTIILISFVLLLALPFSIYSQNEFETSNIIRKAPYLIYNGNNTEMLVLWQLSKLDTCLIKWGNDTQYLSGVKKTYEYGNDHQYKYLITNLTPDNKYYYKIEINNNVYKGSFYTAPNKNSEYLNFFVYGDTRSFPSVHNNIAKKVISCYKNDSNLQTFILSTGDFVNNSDIETHWDYNFFDPLYSSLKEMLANIPFQSCIGNHERTGKLYKKYFPYPYITDNFYWSFDYGPAHFSIVDQYTSYDSTSKQLTWLEKDLALTNKKWKFIILHEPGWTAGHGHENNKDVQKYIQPICEKYGVQIVFGGHNHYYARAEVDGIIHITTGGGGAPLYNPDPTYPNIVAASKSHHFCKIKIIDNKLRLEAITPDGEIVDEFILEK
ncbi:MAG: metallophosphoesterase family protein [Candidatus Marinimicrobia bacterium]|nr:metallophosphoesterase family protein [Candidatus Neomarinimicrobiota bacterium]